MNGLIATCLSTQQEYRTQRCITFRIFLTAFQQYCTTFGMSSD